MENDGITTTEGDLEKNAKLWYEQVDPALLARYWGNTQPVENAVAALRQIQTVLYEKNSEKDKVLEEEMRRVRWKELVCILEALEREVGWAEVDGTLAYTKEAPSSHKSMVLGRFARQRMAC